MPHGVRHPLQALLLQRQRRLPVQPSGSGKRRQSRVLLLVPRLLLVRQRQRQALAEALLLLVGCVATCGGLSS